MKEEKKKRASVWVGEFVYISAQVQYLISPGERVNLNGLVG